MSSTKMYRVNVKVVIPAPKAVELLAEVKSKKGVADLEEYFTKHFNKVMEVAAKQLMKTTSTTTPFGYKLFANGWSKENSKEYFYNFGIQGVYKELVAFMENSYVHTMLRFISPYSKKMMYKPHDEKKEPHGDYYIHIGDGPYHFNLPNLKMGERKAGIPYSVVAAKTSASAPEASAAKRKGPPPPPPCELEIVSRSLADKMRKAKEAETEYEMTVKKIEELKERLKELSTKKGDLKADADKLKKRLNTLIEEEADECNSQASVEEEDEVEDEVEDEE